MKTIGKMIIALLLALGAAGIIPAAAEETAARPQIILYTCYQEDEGDRIQIGCVDEKGGIWTVTGTWEELQWPFRPEDQAAWLASSRKLVKERDMSHDELFAMKSLFYGMPDQGRQWTAAADDAGIESTWAVFRTKKEDAKYILLGMSGDVVFENTDPNAQALYLQARQLFPGVTSYAGEEWMGPAGFRPVPVMTFLGREDVDLTDAEVEATVTDCEAGPRRIELAEPEKEGIIRMALNGRVTGKANGLMVTGGTTVYTFRRRDGSYLMSLELYDGMLVYLDGMYRLE